MYSRLTGRKFVTTQLYVSRYEALLYSDYHEARCKKAGAPNDSVDLQEAVHWMRRSEDLVSEITKNNQSLFEDLGAVRVVVFADTAELRAAIEPLWTIRALKRVLPPPDAGNAALQKWRDDTLQQIQAAVDAEYVAGLTDLLKCLNDHEPLR